MIKLNKENIKLIAKEVEVPTYDRSQIKTGIVHVGIGGFHRSHQAFYTDELLRTGITDWGICGIALLQSDRKIYETLVDQNGLYTLVITDPDGTQTARVIGSITEYLFAPEDQDAVIEKMAAASTKIITLTITEGGYNFDATGEFLFDAPLVQSDFKNPQNPVTIFGYLTQALTRRRARELGGLTIQSCDNIQHNGWVTKKMLQAFLSKADPGLMQWVENNVSFPNSMVDRITPVTTREDIEELKQKFEIDDAWPVKCEPFCQWVIEDKFNNGRPPWEQVGAQFVADVDPYEKMKIRLLNGGHVALGLTGFLCGHKYVHEAASDAVLEKFLMAFMDYEVTPVLDEVIGIDLKDYKMSLLSRFKNPHIKDQLTRIVSGNSAKIPKFILPTSSEQLERGGPITRSVAIIAAWCRYLEQAGKPGHQYEIQDEMGDELQKAALLSVDDPLAFLNIKSVFGHLSLSTRFTDIYLSIINDFRTNNPAEVISKCSV